MKLTKYLLVACTALFLASCNDDENLNTDGNVTVQFASATMKAKENADLFYVPLEVNGKTNGPIRVTVEVAETTSSPAEEDVHYILTSKTVVIPNDSTEVSLEFAAINDMDINDDREFTVSITNVEGAKVGQNSSVTVTITDDDSLFYEALQGNWTLTCIDDEGAEGTFNVKIYGVDEGEEGYEQTLYLSGFMGYNWVVMEMTYIYDSDENVIYLSLPFGQQIAEGVNFGLGGTNEVVLASLEGNYIYFDGEYVATASLDMKSITFEPDVMTTGAIFSGADFTGYVWFQYSNFVMTR